MSISLSNLTKLANSGRALSEEEVEIAVGSLAGSSESLDAKTHFLKALHDRGEYPSEIAAFAESFLKRASSPGVAVMEMARQAIDIVGTGGDRSGAYNFSTTSSFILASMGIRVIKHGNRGATSATGSADFLEALGIPLESDPEYLERSLQACNFCFLFARAYHPAFKAIVPVRQTLAENGVRTLFNLLGPLINPARPSHQVMGVYSEHLVEPVAAALEKLGVVRGLVVHGRIQGGGVLDKFTTAGYSHVRGVGELRDIVTTWSPEDLGLSLCDFADLKGGDVQENLGILQALLEGRANRGVTETVLLNAGAGLWVMKQASSLKEGIAKSREQLESGSVQTWLTGMRAFHQGSTSP